MPWRAIYRFAVEPLRETNDNLAAWSRYQRYQAAASNQEAGELAAFL